MELLLTSITIFICIACPVRLDYALSTYAAKATGSG